MTNKRIAPLLLAVTCVLCRAPDTHADVKSFNGTWTLNEEASQTFKEAGKVRNKELLAERRIEHKKEFDRSPGTPSGRGQTGGIASHAEASMRMMREDERPPVWEATDEVAQMLEAESIKLYYARKIAILYGAERKRLLTVNPAGRSFSVKGSSITKDEIGTSLTYLEDETIVIETNTRWRDKLIERFELNDTSDHLLVTIRMQQIGQGPWLEYVRVFNRAN